MAKPEEPPAHLPAGSFDQLRHDLMNPLATIRGRAQLLARAVTRSTAIDEEERARLLRGLVAIDQAVRVAVDVLGQADTSADAPGSANRGDVPSTSC